jgi:hypothetical protein
MSSQFLILTLSGWLGVMAVVLIASLSPDFKNRPPLVFKYPQRERNAALISVSLFFLISIALAWLTPDWIMALPDRFSPMEWSIAVLSLLIALIASLILQYRKQPLLSFGWHKKLWRPASRLAIALVFLVFFLSGAISHAKTILTSDALLTFLLLIIIYLAWETAFRGFLQPRFSAWLGQTWGWLFTSLLAILLILPIGISFGMSNEFLFRIIGNQLMLGWIMTRSGHVFPGALWVAASTWLTFA